MFRRAWLQSYQSPSDSDHSFIYSISYVYLFCNPFIIMQLHNAHKYSSLCLWKQNCFSLTLREPLCPNSTRVFLLSTLDGYNATLQFLFFLFFMSASRCFPLTNALCVARLLGNSKWMGNSWTIVLHLILHLTRTTWCWSAERHFNWPPETSIFQRVIRSRQMEYHRKLVTFSTVSHFPQTWV